MDRQGYQPTIFRGTLYILTFGNVAYQLWNFQINGCQMVIYVKRMSNDDSVRKLLSGGLWNGGLSNDNELVRQCVKSLSDCDLSNDSI